MSGDIGDLLEKTEARALRWERLHDHRTEQLKKVKAQHDELRQQRDELLQVAKDVKHLLSGTCVTIELRDRLCNMLENVLKHVEEQEVKE